MKLQWSTVGEYGIFNQYQNISRNFIITTKLENLNRFLSFSFLTKNQHLKCLQVYSIFKSNFWTKILYRVHGETVQKNSWEDQVKCLEKLKNVIEKIDCTVCKYTANVLSIKYLEICRHMKSINKYCLFFHSYFY